jgi:hypothetical protein
VTSYLDGTTDRTTDHLRSIVLGKSVGHRRERVLNQQVKGKGYAITVRITGS